MSPVVMVQNATDAWEIVTALATAAAAVVTALMAIATFLMAKRTRAEAQATEKAATAAQDSAKATLELARLGALTYQPALGRERVPGDIGDTDGARGPVHLVNLGAGGAFDVCYVRREAAEWSTTKTIQLRPGEKSAPLRVSRQDNAGVPTHWFDLPGTGAAMSEVMFCRDVLDNRYRFLIGPDGHGMPVQVTSYAEAQKPGIWWWNDPLLWSPHGGSGAVR